MPVVLALLLGVAVIVVVIVKMSSSKQPEPEVASTPPRSASPAAAAAAPASAEPPPPPPAAPSGEAPPPPPPAAEPAATSAVPDSAERAGSSARKMAGARAARESGCEDPCHGSATDQLVRALGSKAAQARACYERALANNSGLSGKLEIAVRVSPAGAICSAKPSSDTLKDPEVLRCVLGRITSGILPKPTGGCVDASVPINFKPAGAG
jgi:hypothetical protein